MRLTYEEQMNRAAYIAASAHEGHYRKSGEPYIGHPIRVMARVRTIQEKIVAILHDTIEDTPVTIEDLREQGFSEDILEALDAVTKRPGETYAKFIERIAEAGPLAIIVKLADIDDNTADMSALDPEEANFLLNRYNKARATLNQIYLR